MNFPFSSLVLHGDQSGRSIGFPTLNFDPTTIPPETKQGVYSSHLLINGKTYLGALYYGPRLVKNEITNVLEVYVYDFDQEIYGQTVKFSLGQFIRPVLDFDSLVELKKQLSSDIARIQELES